MNRLTLSPYLVIPCTLTSVLVILLPHHLPTKSTQQQLQPQKRKDLPMHIVVVNCQSIKSDGKPSQLRNLVSSIQADIVIGTESWLNPTIRDAEVFPEGFKAYRRDRTDGKGGGVF
jgi:hypothetical protein